MLPEGTVVRSLCGRDKHRYYVVLESNIDWILLADGKVRTLESPKRKNIKHVQVTKTKINLGEITSNKSLRLRLEPLNVALREDGNPKGGNLLGQRRYH